jgi:hypothetical protein
MYLAPFITRKDAQYLVALFRFLEDSIYYLFRKLPVYNWVQCRNDSCQQVQAVLQVTLSAGPHDPEVPIVLVVIIMLKKDTPGMSWGRYLGFWSKTIYSF